MDNQLLLKRTFNLDVLRIIALIFIICLHYFLYTGFYSKELSSNFMYVAYLARNLFLLGLPMFMLLTGFLQGNKKFTVSKGYFIKITKFLIPYVIITLFYLLIDAFYLKSQYSVQKTIETFTTFINYSWYVEMYIGLFLLIPFLNMTWSCFTQTKHEAIFIGILVGLTLLPSLINSFDFSSVSTIMSTSQNKWTFIPDWWNSLYPITYYFTGAFLKKRVENCKLKAAHYALLFILSYILTNIYHFIRDFHAIPSIDDWCYWKSITLYIPAIFLFMFIAKINFKNTPKGMRIIAAKLSDLCLGALIASKIADMLVYSFLKSRLSFIEITAGFPIIILIILIISFSVSFAADLIYKGIIKLSNTKQRS